MEGCVCGVNQASDDGVQTMIELWKHSVRQAGRDHSDVVCYHPVAGVLITAFLGSEATAIRRGTSLLRNGIENGGKEVGVVI